MSEQQITTTELIEAMGIPADTVAAEVVGMTAEWIAGAMDTDEYRNGVVPYLQGATLVQFQDMVQRAEGGVR